MVIGVIATLFAESTIKDHRTPEERMDSLDAVLPYLEKKVLSTLLFGASSPVNLTGEARIKGQYHRFTTYPDFLGPHGNEDGIGSDTIMSGERSYLQAGWEESMIRLGLVVRPSRNTVLWSKFGFAHTFPGNRVTNLGGGLSPVQGRHNAQGWPTNMYEDMCAGIAIRTIPVSFWMKTGSILWSEASPFTIWKAQARMFAWEYLPYEIEEPISGYYDYNIAKGEKIGRAAWHKKAFNGFNLESITLPRGFYLNLIYGKFGEYDKFEREGMDFAVDLAYAAEDSLIDIIETGYGDSYRHMFHARLAKEIKGLMLGLNYNNIHASEDIIYAQSPAGIFFNSMFDLEFRDFVGIFHGPNWASESKYYSRDSLTGAVIDSTIASSVPQDYIGPGKYYDSVALDCGRGFYKESQAFSVDLRGTIGTNFEIHADIGFSKVDTNWVYGDTINSTFGNLRPLSVKKREIKSTGLIPALYTKLKYNGKIGLESDIAYVSEGFYSPFSFVCPMDAFYAFGTNLLGAGTFMGPTEASPYFQNMAGAWLSVSPKLPAYGHLRVKYGQHFQLHKGRDLLYFPYRLNGMDLNSILYSTYAKWGSGTIDFPFPDVKYDRRLGDESYDPTLHIDGRSKGEIAHVDEGPEKGGLRADYLAVYEGFVAYDDPFQVMMNYLCTTGKIQRERTFTLRDTVGFVCANGVTSDEIAEGAAELGYDTFSVADTMYVYNPAQTMHRDANGFVPLHKKYSFNFELDGAYDIGPLVRYKRELFLGGYTGLSGVAIHPKPLAFNAEDDDILLWSLYLRFEPAIALTKKFYCIGLLGYENWRSEKSWMNIHRDSDDNSEMEGDALFQRVPINYKETAYGIGFDWDMLDRVGLHGRYKLMRHYDEQHSANNQKWFLLSMELKMFF